MENPFWLQGPVPLSRLGDFALPRNVELTAVLDALSTSRQAVIAGPPGSGKSTFAHQITARLGVRTVVIASRGLLRGDEDDHLKALATELGQAGSATPTWGELGLGANDLLVLDGVRIESNQWIQRLRNEVKSPILSILASDEEAPAEAVHLRPLSLSDCSSFLETRARRASCTWTSAALEKAAQLADGSPALMQHVGASCIQAASEQPRRRVDLDTFVEGAYRAATTLPAWLLSLATTLDGPRIALAKALVRFPAETPTQWANRCGLEPKAAVVHLRRMVERGILKRTERGRYEVATPLLGLHLQARHGSLVHVLRASRA